MRSCRACGDRRGQQLREGLVLLLASAGHEVVAAVGTAPEILPAHRPNVAVSDLRMPLGFCDEGLRAALRKE